jgi:hypothetical protein
VSARGALLAGALAIGAIAPIVAHATAVGDYAGGVKGEPASFLTFDVDKVKGKRKVRRIITANIPFDCDVGTPGATQTMRVLGSYRINKRKRFRGTGEAILIGADPTGKIRGQLRKGGKAVGKIRLFGELDGVVGSDCDTGVVEWRAEKVD